MMGYKRLTKAVAAAGFGLLTVVGAANAAVSFFPPITTFEDDDLDFFIDMGNGAANTLDVGDRFVAVAKWNVTAGVIIGGPANIAPQELTAISDITVISKVATATAGLFNFTFGPTVGGVFGLADNNGAGSAGAGTGAMVKLYLDGTPDLTLAPINCTSLADCSAKATDGAHWATFGFDGDVNELWAASDAFDVPSAVLGIGASTDAGGLNFYLNVLENFTGQTIVPQQCFFGLPAPANCPTGGDDSIDITGSGVLKGGQGLAALDALTGGSLVADGAVARSDTDFQVATVPEPGTLALLGLGLVGAGALRRKVR